MKKILTFGLAAFIVLVFISTVRADGPISTEKKTEWTDDKGAHVPGTNYYYNVAQDRNLEKTGARHEPEPLDKYMKRHFDTINSTLDQIEKRVDSLDQRVLQTQQEIKDVLRKLPKELKE